MYSLPSYGAMLLSSARVDAYAAALQRAVRPGCAVLEIGAGPGVFSVLAAKLGAGHVWAVEPDPVLQVGREIAVLNGVADRVTFVSGLSTQLELPAPADVIVSDLRGILPVFAEHFTAIIDARNRLLAPGGALISERDRLRCALAHDPERTAAFDEPWRSGVLGVQLSPGRRFATNQWKKASRRATAISTSEDLCTFDYRTLESADVRASTSVEVTERCRCDGVLVWFDAELLPGIGFSNAPDSAELIYGRALFPLHQAIDVEPGDRAQVALEARHLRSDYIWRWRVRVVATDGMVRCDEQHDSLAGLPLSPHALRHRAHTFVPQPSDDGVAARRVLELVDGARSLEGIARVLATEHPDRFPDWEAALAFVADTIETIAR